MCARTWIEKKPAVIEMGCAIALLLALFVLSSCGKNQPIPPGHPGIHSPFGTGTGFVPGGGVYAPIPPNGGYPYSGGFGRIPYTHPAGGFLPGSRNGYPYPTQGFNPWLGGRTYGTPHRQHFYPGRFGNLGGNGNIPAIYSPLQSWMTQSPVAFGGFGHGSALSGAQYWNQLWSGWLAYAIQQNLAAANFHLFWTVYLRQVLQLSQEPWYRFFNTVFYPWVTPSWNWQSARNVSPDLFWRFYSGASFGALNEFYGVEDAEIEEQE